MRFWKTVVLTGSLLVAFNVPAHARDDYQYWSQYMFNLVDQGKWHFGLFTEGWMYNDAGNFSYYAVSPKLKYDAWKYVSLGMNYTYQEAKSFNTVEGHSEFKYTHRWEWEVNPHFDITPWLKFSNRNRLELRWIEDQGYHNTRSRHLIGFEVPIKNAGLLKAAYIDNEFFYNYKTDRYDENRATPLGLKFKLNDNVSLKLYYTIQTKKTNTWSANEALGTMVTVNF